ncbi:response regulator transcription factor [Novosphingobium album (ex Liu et al. 2023)]|uniref:LuxR C-terminal-related transcriptional regulator n=1 Tax=Novosphingobium album (ex Liu et al. 2023) TaxID=3031130 RepID=A0ABT5WSS9_9SPHN|nr:LuxR C-terminal-related transcriptional regulator [Novosphingobium album (ex Liu et al. 2023)]MDE8653101.1 LuxR C-terminal-related transcriptional regulator [Novosphingobium album (ex Liu et al. 2023)]
MAEHRVYSVPFETRAELLDHWPREGVLLVEDREDNIAGLIAEMVRRGDWLPIIAFSDQAGARRVVQAISEGAIDYLEFPASALEIIEAALQVEGDSGVRSARLREAQARSRMNRLTPREKDVLLGVVDGQTNRLIGERLAISPRTVEIHRANMLRKLDASHSGEAIRIAIEASMNCPAVH